MAKSKKDKGMKGIKEPLYSQKLVHRGAEGYEWDAYGQAIADNPKAYKKQTGGKEYTKKYGNSFEKDVADYATKKSRKRTDKFQRVNIDKNLKEKQYKDSTYKKGWLNSLATGQYETKSTTKPGMEKEASIKFKGDSAKTDVMHGYSFPKNEKALDKRMKKDFDLKPLKKKKEKNLVEKGYGMVKNALKKMRG